jgi:hypothetical protein
MVVFVLSVYCINWLSDIRVESNRKYFQPPLKVIEEARQRLNSRLDTVVLLPRTVAGDIWEKLDDLEDGGVKATFTKGTGAAKILSARPREIELEITSEDGGYVTVSQLFFPGWTAGIDGTPTVLAVEPDEIGLVRISAPPGNNLVRLRLQKLNAEFYGDIISVVSLVALFGLLALNSPLR